MEASLFVSAGIWSWLGLVELEEEVVVGGVAWEVWGEWEQEDCQGS